MAEYLATWQGYVVDGLVNSCTVVAERDCKGCKNRCESSILHSCKSLSTLDIMRKHLAANILKFSSKSKNAYFDRFAEMFPEWDGFRSECIRESDLLLRDLSPESAYYGRWVTPEVDATLRRGERRLRKSQARGSEMQSRRSRQTPYSKTLIKTARLNISSVKQVGDGFPEQSQNVLNTPLFTTGETNVSWLFNDTMVDANNKMQSTGELFNLYRNE